MHRPIRVLSLYEGFFAGGARILHTDVIAGLHAAGGQRHSVLSIASAVRRDASIQHLHRDPRYVRLTGSGGRTVPENLQTLCQSCTLGRSNTFIG